MIVTDMPVESLVPYAEDGLNCGSAWKKDPVSGVIGVEQGLWRSLGDGHVAPMTRAWSRSIFPRPYIWRFTSLSLVI